MRWQREGKRKSVAVLPRAKVGDGNGNNWMARRGFAGRRASRHERASEETKREDEKRGGANHLFTIVLEDVPAEVLILYDVGKLFRNVRAVHFHIFLLQVRRLKGNFVQHFFENGVEAARADVFRLLVDHDGVARQGRDRILCESQLEDLRVQGRNV